MKNKNISVIFVCIAAFLWGCMGIFVRKMNAAGLYAIDVVQVRITIALLFVGLFILIKNPSGFKIKIKDIWCFLGTGICSLLFFSWCLFSGMEIAPLSVVTILLYTAPAFVMIWSIILFKEKMNRYKVISLLLTLIGCILVSGLGNAEQVSVKGILLGIGSGFGYALYSIFGRYAIKKGYDSWTITFYTFLFCVIGCSFMADFGKIFSAVEEDGTIVLWMAGMAFFTGFLAYVFYTKGLEGIESSKASIIATLEPVVATLVGLICFGEKTGIPGIAGIICVISGIVLLALK